MTTTDPQSEAEQFVSSPEEWEIEHGHLLFGDEGHGVGRTENRVEYSRRTVEFLRSHV